VFLFAPSFCGSLFIKIDGSLLVYGNGRAQTAATARKKINDYFNCLILAFFWILCISFPREIVLCLWVSFHKIDGSLLVYSNGQAQTAATARNDINDYFNGLISSSRTTSNSNRQRNAGGEEDIGATNSGRVMQRKHALHRHAMLPRVCRAYDSFICVT